MTFRSAKPIKKSGTEIPIAAKTRENLSVSPPRLAPATKPIIKERVVEIIKAASTNYNFAGNLRANISEMG